MRKPSVVRSRHRHSSLWPLAAARAQSAPPPDKEMLAKQAKEAGLQAGRRARQGQLGARQRSAAAGDSAPLQGRRVRQQDHRLAAGHLQVGPAVQGRHRGQRRQVQRSAQKARSSRRPPASNRRSSTACPSRRSTRRIRTPASRCCGTSQYEYWNEGNSHNVTLLNWVSPQSVDREAGAGRLLPLLRRPGPGVPPAESEQLLGTVRRRGHHARRSERHRGVDLALSRLRQARLELGLRSGAAPRARRQPVQPLRRLPRLGHESGRWPVLRRQARGLHLEARRRGRHAAHRRSAQLHPDAAKQVWLPTGGWRSMWDNTPVVGYQDPQLEGHRLGAGASRRWRGARAGSSRGRRRTSTTCSARSSSTSTRKPTRVPGTASSAGPASCSTRCKSSPISGKSSRAPTARKESLWASNFAFQCAENIKMNRATLGRLAAEGQGRPQRSPRALRAELLRLRRHCSGLGSERATVLSSGRECQVPRPTQDPKPDLEPTSESHHA